MLLKGLKVVEFASYIAAPGAAGILGDWGADVIKIERPGGDAMRHAFAGAKMDMPSNPTFDMDNRGKRGIVLDITKPEGRDALARLAEGADVFITNVRMASLQKYGLDEASLRKANPGLVYAIVTGYGLEGPDAAKPGFDVTAFWSRAGVSNMTVPKGEDPVLPRTGMGDHVTGLATAGAILAALYERAQTGQGRLVATSLLATGVYVVGSDLALQMRLGRLASNKPRREPLDPMQNFYRTSEGRWFVVNPRGAADWPRIAKAAGLEHLIKDELFATPKARRTNSAALVALLDAAFSAMSFEEAAARLDEVDMAWAPTQTPAEVVADPQVRASGAIVDIVDANGGLHPSPAAPAVFPGASSPTRPPAPELGEHTRQVLAEIGYGPEEIEAMYAAGAAA